MLPPPIARAAWWYKACNNSVEVVRSMDVFAALNVFAASLIAQVVWQTCRPGIVPLLAKFATQFSMTASQQCKFADIYMSRPCRL